MNKFLVTGESVTKDDLVSAIEAGKIEAKVEEDRVDCLVMDFRPSDLPNSPEELTHEKGMEMLISISEQLASAFHDIVSGDDEDEDDAVPEIDDDDDDEE